MTGTEFVLPGECLPIPRLKVEVLDEHGRVGWTVQTHIVPGLDLDGRASPVVLVPADGPGLNLYTMWWRLFIQRGDCGYELGIVSGMEDPVPEPGESNGLRDFSMAQALQARSDGGLQGVGITIYRFDGTRYAGGRTEFG
jgi:hypothetical protein